MSYSIIWDKEARSFLRKLPKDHAQRIIKKVNSITNDPHHFLESLVNLKSQKLRIGDYRALIDLDENNKTMVVVLIGHRKNVYKNL